LLYLYTLKINFPTRFTLLRGNHECRHLTEYFTFKRECKPFLLLPSSPFLPHEPIFLTRLHKYSEAVYEKCIESFCALPLGAIVDGRFFCVHGGISPELLKVEDMRRLNRFMEPGSHGLLCDLLWADPYPSFGHESESGAHPALAPGTTFVHNQTRGCSFFYTYEAACQFLERNGLLGIIRGHEAQNDGYTMYRKTPSKKFPSVITIFSAPNYLDVYRNRGAVLKYQNKNITIRQYNSSPHPYWLPNFMDAFTWSLPFVGAKIAEMLLAVLSVCSQEELVDSESDSEDEETKAGPDAAARRQQIKSKIIAVGRMQRVFQLLREEAENATELNVDGPMSDGTPANASGLAFGPNALTVQGIQINRSIHNFTEARHSDILNERLPEFAQTQQTIFPAPSMRVLHTTRSGTPTGGTMPGGLNMEYLIKKTLEEDEEQGSMVERLADSIARVRKAGVLGKPEPLKRHGTA
ncbi:Metallo-dependent phosphatase, partial [Pluteus cervinus]